MSLSCRTLIPLMLLASGSATAAPPNAAAQENEILIVSDQDEDRVRREFVKAMALPSAYDQLGRFEDPVCPVVLGLRAPYGDFVADRMRRVAGAAGIKAASNGCSPNVYLFIVRDKSQLVRGLSRSAPAVFGDRDDAGYAERAVLDAGDSPSVAWQVLQYRSSDGSLAYRERLRSNSRDSILKVPAIASRIVSPLRVEFGASVMVIEAKWMLGVDLRQLADFAAMQLYAHTEPQMASEQKAPTILTLLDDARTGRPAPMSVTNWDIAYLKSLYSYSNLYRVNAHYGELAKLMKRSMERQEAAPEN